MHLFVLIFVLLAGLAVGSANAQQACTAGMTMVECDAYLHKPDTGLKPAVEDMGCIEFIQDIPGKVVLTFWKDKERTQLVRDPIVHEKDGTRGVFRQGGWSFDQALNGWVDLCNGSNRSQRDKPFIQKARQSGQCIKMCLLGAEKCKALGYYYQF